jgi:hypothetical protein
MNDSKKTTLPPLSSMQIRADADAQSNAANDKGDKVEEAEEPLKEMAIASKYDSNAKVFTHKPCTLLHTHTHTHTQCAV